MTDESVHIFHRLNNSNYRLWKFNVDAVLKGQGLGLVQGVCKLNDLTSQDQKDLWTKRERSGSLRLKLQTVIVTSTLQIMISCPSKAMVKFI